MKDMGSARKGISSRVITITIILAAEVFVADLLLPLSLAVWLPYAALVLISLWAPYRHYTAIVAIACTALILLGFFLSPSTLAGAAPPLSLFNRALGVLVIWITAFLCIQRKRVEETRQALSRLSAQLSRSLNLQEIYPVFAAAVKTHLPYDRIGVVVPVGESLSVALSVAEPPLANHQGKMWLQAQKTAVEWVLAHKAPRLMRDLAVERVYADEVFVHQEGVRAVLMMPLLVGGDAVGTLFLDSLTPGVYTEWHQELLGPLAEQLALALNNACLYAEVTRHAEELSQKVQLRTQELQVANRRLEAASHHKSAFLANTSHELRTPLVAIIGFTELLKKQAVGPLTKQQARYVDQIHASGKHLHGMINDLLDLSKVEAGKLEFRPVPFVLQEALGAALRELKPMADAKGLSLSLHAEGAPNTLIADPVRFKQILHNLLSNAVKFTPDAGSVRVTAHAVHSSQPRGQRTEASEREPSAVHDEPRRDCVEISVHDTGIGIQADDLPRLFQRFSQLGPSFEKHHHGTGLGLALTKQLVDLQGGMIWAESSGKGLGSTFTFRLPLASPPTVPSHEPETKADTNM